MTSLSIRATHGHHLMTLSLWAHCRFPRQELSVNEVQMAAEPRGSPSSAKASRDLVFIANKTLLLTSLLGYDRISAKRSRWNGGAFGAVGDY